MIMHVYVCTLFIPLLLENFWPLRGEGAKATEGTGEESEEITPTEPEDEEEQEEEEGEEVEVDQEGDETGQAVGGDGAEENNDSGDEPSQVEENDDYPEGHEGSGQGMNRNWMDVEVSSEDDPGQEKEAEEGFNEKKKEAKEEVEDNEDPVPSAEELVKTLDDLKLQHVKDLEHPDNKETLPLDPEMVESWWRLDPNGACVGGTPNRKDAADETEKKRERKATEDQTGEGKRAKTIVQKKQRDEEKVPEVMDLESDDDEKRGTFQDWGT
jgi:hypothetical protein